MQVVGGIRLLAAMLMKLQEEGWSRSGISMVSSFPSNALTLPQPCLACLCARCKFGLGR